MSKRRRTLAGLAIALTVAGTVLSPLPAEAETTLQPNFISRCVYSHSAPDDPIVFPNEPGASHLHDFFANTTTDASSTAGSLRDNETTCQIKGDTSAYWTPALYDSEKLVVPMSSTVYYRTGGKDRRSIQAFPADLAIVAKEQNVRATWACDGKNTAGVRQAEPPTCTPATHLVMVIKFPDCWDGTNLDVPDHTSHMAFSANRLCPSSHPRPMPTITLQIHYPSDGGDIVLGNPEMPVLAHADFLNAWKQERLENLVRVCLNAGRQCGTSPPSG